MEAKQAEEIKFLGIKILLNLNLRNNKYRDRYLQIQE
jgi:hypothetical protein